MDRVSSRWTSLYQISEPKLSSDRRRGIGDTRARLNFKGLPIALNSFITAALMGTKAFTALLCGFALAGQMRGQEVVVGRETKPKPTERAAPMSQPSDSESGNATPTKARVRAKKSTSTLPTVEQMRMETAFTKLANGFDFPVGIPDAQGYYKARGFRSQGHLGEDWDGVRGGDTDRGDPVYSIGDGMVVFARDCHMGWGNVIIVRHAYRENGSVKN